MCMQQHAAKIWIWTSKIILSYANALFREIQNILNWLSPAIASFAKHKILLNKEYFFAKYETRFT